MILNPNKVLLKLLSNRLGRSATQLELAPRVMGRKLPDLCESEKKSIIELWGELGAGIIDFDYWKFYKMMTGESCPVFVADNIYWSRIIRALNPASMTRTYINKSLYPIIFKGLKQPNVLINCIEGSHYNAEMDRIDRGDVVKILQSYGDEVIIKLTTASSGGHGVTKIKCGDSADHISDVLASIGKNYICQGVLRQSENTAIFNESSLNTFRINTVNINGTCSCECIMFRHGQNGSIVDNFAAGGIACGMTKEGVFNGVNVNSQLQRVARLSDGTSYEDLSIPEISNVIHTAIDAHQRFMPYIGHAAWDFAIDENGDPVMIEVNLMLPGIMIEQLTSCGSIFGDRTEEVIRYTTDRNKSLSWTEFVGGWK